MGTAAQPLDLAQLGVPVPIGYGLVRGVGHIVAQFEKTDKSILRIYANGEGPWDAIVRAWINRKAVTLPNTSILRFHPGDDGEIGAGMAASSTGGDQKVDSFFAEFPGGTNFVTFSRYCYTFVKFLPDPGAPSPDPEFLADYQALKVRLFDNAGAQTSFAWSQNWVWCATDYIIRRFILPEGKVNQPLTAAEKARFDFGLLKACADHADFDIGGGVKRWSDGGLVWEHEGLTAAQAIEQLLLLCNSYITEVEGKVSLSPNKNRASVFTFRRDHILPGSFRVVEPRVRFNQVLPVFQDINQATGSSDDATRFAMATPEPLDHRSHQAAAGFTARGMARMRKVVGPLNVDFAANTPERVWRGCRSQLLRECGAEADPGNGYKAPVPIELIGTRETVEVMPGDVVTVDKSISEEYGGADYEVTRVGENPDETRLISAVQFNANAFPDAAVAQQGGEAPNVGTGLADSIGSAIENIGSDPRNMVRNGGGQEGQLGVLATGWALNFGNPVVPANDFAKFGDRSLKIDNPTATDSNSGQVFPVLAGRIYRVSGWIKTSALPAADAGFGAVINCTLSAGSFIILDKITLGDPVANEPGCGIQADGVAHDWTFVQSLFRVSATANISVEVQLGHGGSQSGTAWFDGVFLEEMPPNTMRGGWRADQGMNDSGQLLDADRIAADGASFVRVNPNERTGGGRGFSALNASNNLITGTTNKTVAQIEDAQVRATTAIDVGNVVVAAGLDFTRGYTNKHLGNVPDDTQRKARTAAHSSYRPLSNPLTATDAGATATVNIAAFTQRAAGVDISVNAGSVGTLSFDTLYFIYYDDAGFAGGSVTYNATTVKETALNGSGRFFVGSIRTPKDGGPDTKGAGDGGSGAQSGLLWTPRAGAFQNQTVGISPPPFANPVNALDDDDSNFSAGLDSTTGDAGLYQWWYGFGSNTRQRFKSVTLFVESEVIKTGAGTGQGRLQYSTNAFGQTITATIYDVNASRAKQVDSVVLANTINLALLGVRANATWISGTTSIEVRVYRVWVEAED